MAVTDVLYVNNAGRADPNCALGHVLKVLFKNDDFMTKVCKFQYNLLLVPCFLINSACETTVVVLISKCHSGSCSL